MSKVVVRGGMPGKVRVELEGTDLAVEVDSGLSLYTGLHELQPWLQSLADAAPVPVVVPEVVPNPAPVEPVAVPPPLPAEAPVDVVPEPIATPTERRTVKGKVA